VLGFVVPITTVQKYCAKTILLSQTSTIFDISSSNFNLEGHLPGTGVVALRAITQ